MKTASDVVKSANCYTPSRALKNHLEKQLQLQRTEVDEGDAANRSLSNEIRNMNRTKVHVLNNIIFPSMANIVYFLETVSKNPELQKVFDNDLKELFGIRYPLEFKDKSYSPIIRRLIEAMIFWTQDMNETADERQRRRNNNFRLALLEMMQRVIFYRMIILSMDEIGGEMANFVVKNDIGRAWSWTKLFAKSVEWDAGQPRRPPNF